MKITKTQQALLDRIKASPNKRATVEFGLERGRGGTGKLRSYGNRELTAAQGLIARGIVRVVDRNSSPHYTRGYASTFSFIQIALV